MRAIIRLQGPPEKDAPSPPLARRLAWFVGLALAGVLATAVFAEALHALLFLH